MNPTDPEAPDALDPALRKAVTTLHAWERDVDAVQRARLAAARRRALTPTDARPGLSLAWGGAIAALLLLALGIGFWPQAPLAPDAALLQATLEASRDDWPAAQDAELLLDEDLDLYLWLDGHAEAT